LEIGPSYILKSTLTKSDWLTAGECLTKAWRELRTYSGPPNEATLFRMEQGQEVGVLARKLYPDGVLVLKTPWKSAVERTGELIAEAVHETLFEATFLAGSLIAKADILTRQNGTWHVQEVKSSLSSPDKAKELLDDLAYTVMVLKRAGLPVGKASLLLLSREYRFAGSPDCLFDVVDQTIAVNARVNEFQKAASPLLKALFADIPPTPILVSACRQCSFFDSACLGSGVLHTVLEIPKLHPKKLKRLSSAGVIALSSIPEDLGLNAGQQRARHAALSGNMFVEPGLNEAMKSIQWPCHYLDFETVATVRPLYPGHACHQQVLTQFSIHHRDAIDGQVRHSEYLADATKQCERELTEALIKALETQGSILVYTGFEKTRIKALAAAFPELGERLGEILDRLVDLCSFVSDYIYHPEFRGSFSIKKVLPALVPDLSYSALDVADGDTAITRFARMARGEISLDAIETTRQQLLAYCKLDTLAMLRLHETLSQLASVAANRPLATTAGRPVNVGD
jgi:hypothetical protein